MRYRGRSGARGPGHPVKIIIGGALLTEICARGIGANGYAAVVGPPVDAAMDFLPGK